MEQPQKQAYEFGPFRFDAAARVLYRGAEIVPLSPKAADTLLVLLEHRGQVVDKNELLRLVWPDTFVEEIGLARNISALRKSLGDESIYIETIPKRGYRFLGEEQSSQGAGGSATTPVDQEGRPPKQRVWLLAILAVATLVAVALFFALRSRPSGFRAASIAVLPLRNLSNDPAQDYLSDGLTEELATVLAKTGARVIASDSVRQLRQGATLDEVGRRLGVEAVVEGTVLASGERVLVNARLIEVRSGRLVWAESYQRSLADVIALQSELAVTIGRELTATVSPAAKQRAPRPVQPEAYRSYLKGRYFWNKRTETGLRKAIEAFQEAIAGDPSWAQPYTGVADSYALLASSFYDAMPPREAMPAAKTAALKALELDPQLAEAHTSLAYVRMAYDWDLPAAEQEFRQALQSSPGYATAHHWYAHWLLAAGKPEQAAIEMRQAQSLDPLSLPVNVGVGWCWYFARRYDTAIAQYRRALELDDGFALAHQALAMALEIQGGYPDAIAEFQKAVTLSGGSASAVASLGHAYGLAGKKREAQTQLNRLEEVARNRYVPAIYRAEIYLGLGDRDRAAVWMSRARDERSEYLIYYKLGPSFDSLRGDPRFALKLEPLPAR